MSNETTPAPPGFPPIQSSVDASQRALWWREMAAMLRQVENDFEARIEMLQTASSPAPAVPASTDAVSGVVEPGTLWLAPAEPGTAPGFGSGTFLDPLRIHSAQDFDAAITRPDVNVLWLGIPEENNGGWTVSGLTIDGNHSRVATDNRRSVRGGLRIYGNAAHVSHVEVIGLRGRYEVDPVTGINYEAFGISTINAPAGPWQGPDGGTVIEDCIVRDCCPKSYCSAFSIGYRTRQRPLAPSVVQRCRVPQFTDNWFAYAACDATTFRDCFASDCYFAFFNDTDGVDGWLIEGCETYTRRTGLYISAVEGAAGHGRKCRVRVIHSTFGWVHETGQDKFVALLWDKKVVGANAAEWCDFEISNCRVLAPPPPPNETANKLCLANVLASHAIGSFLTADGRPRQRIRLVNSDFFLRGGQQKESALLLLDDPTGATEIGDITVAACHVRATLDATVTKFYLASMNCPKAARLRISGCTHPAFAETRMAVALMNVAANPLVLANNTTFA
jgi:hypothetical protein